MAPRPGLFSAQMRPLCAAMIAREIESPELIAFILVNLGFTTSLQGRPAEAVAYLEEGLRRTLAWFTATAASPTPVAMSFSFPS